MSTKTSEDRVLHLCSLERMLEIIIDISFQEERQRDEVFMVFELVSECEEDELPQMVIAPHFDVPYYIKINQNNSRPPFKRK